MRFLESISPSFEMKVQSFIPNESIELTGRNNWNSLMLAHSVIIILWIMLTCFALNSTWFENFLLFRLLTISLLFIIGNFVYRTFEAARNSTYLKEEIQFSKEGIFLNANKGGTHSQFIKREGLKNLHLIFDGQRFKFLLFSLNKPYFEFAISQNENLTPDTFLKTLTKIFDLEIADGATFDIRTILTLKKKQTPKEKKGKIDVPKKKKQSVGNTAKTLKVAPIEKYKPKGFYYYQLKKELIIEQNLDSEVVGISTKIGVSKLHKIIWYRNAFFLKKRIKFSEIKQYNFEVQRRSQKSRKYIEGVLYIVKADNKKEKLFTIERELHKQQELVELEVLNDLDFLSKLIKKEISAEKI